MRTVLITGAGRRIGAHIAEHMAQNDWNVIIQSHTAFTEAQTHADFLRTKYHVRVWVMNDDLHDENAICHLIPKAQKMCCNTLEALILNAARFDYDTVATLQLSIAEKQMRFNLWTPLLLAQSFIQHFRALQGVIIPIVDQRILQMTQNYTSYTLSKRALHDAVQLIAKEGAPKIRAVGLGFGYTTFTSSKQMQQTLTERIQQTPLKTIVQAHDIVKAIQFIANTSSLTGQSIILNSGDHLM